jgi:hypothetical protein
VTEADLRTRFPEIPWDEPIDVHVVGERKAGEDFYGWTCRYCVAILGLKAQDIIHDRAREQVFATRDEALAHIEREHLAGAAK